MLLRGGVAVILAVACSVSPCLRDVARFIVTVSFFLHFCIKFMVNQVLSCEESLLFPFRFRLFSFSFSLFRFSDPME